MRVIIQKNLYDRGKVVFEASIKEYNIEYLVLNEMDEQAMLEYHQQGVSCFVIGTGKLSDNFYNSLSEGSAIIRYGVGYNSIPIDICLMRNIKVAYTPGTLTESVAEHTFALLLGLARNIPTLDNSIQTGKWEGLSGIELNGKTIAILGFGQIGQAVARIAKYGFSMKVKAFDIYLHQNQQLADVLSDNFANVACDADVVSLHMPAIPETMGFLNAERIDMCKDGVFIINTARGELVVEKDLFDALQSRKVAKAALDVFNKEPYNPDPGIDFRKLDNVLMSPHCGSNTKEANEKMAKVVVNNILAYKNGGEMILIPEFQ